MKAARTPQEGASETADRFSLDELRSLAQLASDFDLVELELCRPSGERLRIRRPERDEGAATRSAAPALPVTAQALASEPPPTVDDSKDLRYITSPFVGTFYRSPGAGSAVFVEPGQRVSKGQALCIIEAMKLMNELEAECDCVIVECLAQNSRPVEYGERLFSVRI